jgi:methionyl-tRNA formyltransferase
MIVAALADLAAGTARERPQPQTGVTYARKIEKGETVLDWSRPAVELARAVRAFRPAPGARASLRGELIKVLRAFVAARAGEPGKVLHSDVSGIVVACGEQSLALTELQRAGGRVLDAGAFLRGFPIAPGDEFLIPERAR